MSGRLVAVLGISGVGKTTMISAFTRRYPWVHGVRASALLKDASGMADAEALRTASAKNIHSNQNLLTDAFSRFRSHHPDRHFIFDGHSLIDNDEGLVVVPTATFIQLAPDLIVFLEDDAEAILARRAADTGRVRPQRSIEEIAIHQGAAKEAAIGYGRALDIPCVSIRSGDACPFEQTLLAVFQEQPTGGKRLRSF